MLAAAAYVRRTVPSMGDEDSDQLSLVAVFDGITLKSRVEAFTGGSMLAWFGGIEVDLREAEFPPHALRLSRCRRETAYRWTDSCRCRPPGDRRRRLTARGAVRSGE